MTARVVSLGAPPGSAFVIGSVTDVLKGHIDPGLSKERFQVANYLVGFEAGSPKGLSSIGEALLVNGMCFATSTEEGEYGKVLWGNEFVTGGMFLLLQKAKPTHQLSLDASIPFEKLCQAIYEGVGRPLAFAGFWESETLYTMAIGKPPIHDRPIFENRDYYFPTPHQTLHKKHCFVMGVIASYCDKKWEELNHQLEVALYNLSFEFI